MKIPYFDLLEPEQQLIVQRLHDYYETYDERPPMAKIRNKHWCDQYDVPYFADILLHFPTVDSAFRAADIPVARPCQADFIRAIQRFKEKYGYMPAIGNLDSGEVDYSKSAFLGKYGFRFWSDALAAAGYTRPGDRRNAPTREQLIEDLQNFALKLKRIPMRAEVEDNEDMSSLYYYNKIIGPWITVCEEAKLRELLKLPPLRQEMLDYLQSKIKELGRAPAKTEMKNGKFSAGEYEAEFGSWTLALRKLGYNPLRPSRRRDK